MKKDRFECQILIGEAKTWETVPKHKILSSDSQIVQANTDDLVVGADVAIGIICTKRQMMISVPGYQLREMLHEGNHLMVYRAIRSEDGQEVVLKILKEDAPQKAIADLQHEYEMMKNLQSEGILRTFGLDSGNQLWWMVLEDIGGETLSKLLPSTKLDLRQLLSLAIKITTVLEELHEQNVLHKHINPSHILWNPESQQVKLIGFRISVEIPPEGQPRTPKDHTRVPDIEASRGDWAYIAPEQTGRMDRPLDFRTDLYSLGITLYWMLSGQLSFEADDPMEWVHCHLAKIPKALHEVNPDTPSPLSKIIMKLLAKSAEARYQSPVGLRVDLEHCLEQLETTDTIEDFEIGRQDRVGQFQIPGNLYGREKETQTILSALELISQGGTEFLLVAGYAGVGKSALIQQCFKPTTQQQLNAAQRDDARQDATRRYFISGKLDPVRRDRPYASLIDAFKERIHQILTESEEGVTSWKEKLQQALEPNGQVVIDVIPEMELILGKQAPVPDLSPLESRNRFNLVFRNFVRALAGKDHPLVIFLDDLHWADLPSLKLMDQLLSDSSIEYLLMIGAYQENAIDANHPLWQMLEDIRRHGVTFTTMTLSPLTLEHVHSLIADTLQCDLKDSQPLAELCFQKTQGNPFFLNQFLVTLHHEKLIYYEATEKTWQWEMEKIEAQTITDNVVELMAGKIQKLTNQSQEALKVAACMGSQFELNPLAFLQKQSITDSVDALWEALKEGLILPLGESHKQFLPYDQKTGDRSAILEDTKGQLVTPGNQEMIFFRFLHDHIQQAAYQLLESKRQKEIHLELGWYLLTNTPQEKREEQIFEIVNHLNLGMALVTDSQEKLKLSELNWMAGKKAKASAAFSSAFNYFKLGLSLLEEDNWSNQYELSLKLYTETTEASFLNADFERMKQLGSIVLQKVELLPDKVNIYASYLRAHYAESQLSEAIKTGINVLELLGITFSENPSKEDVLEKLEQLKSKLTGKVIEDFLSLPEMTETHHLAKIKVLSMMLGSAFVKSPNLFNLLTLTIVDLSTQVGNCPLSPVGYVNYGLILCKIKNDFENGFLFFKLASQLVEHFDAREVYPEVNFNSKCHVRHWIDYAGNGLKPALETYQAGLEVGAFRMSAISLFYYTNVSFLTSMHLSKLEQEWEKHALAIAQINQNIVLHWHEVYQQAIANLMGKSEDPCRLIGEHYDEQKMLPWHQETGDGTGLFFLYLNKLILCFLFAKNTEAVEIAQKAESYLGQAGASMAVPAFHFYDALAQLARFPDMSQAKQKRCLNKIGVSQGKLKMWADRAPMNYLNKWFLVEAETARWLEKEAEAIEHYQQAIRLAKEHQYLQEEALAHELFAKFYLSQNKEKEARLAMKEARTLYLKWGAQAKVKHLEENYPKLLASDDFPEESETMTMSLDWTSVMRASQVISSEIVLERLLSRLLQILIENAGAEKGALLLEKEGELVIEIEGDVENQTSAVLQSIPLESSQHLPTSVIHYVARTGKSLVLNETAGEEQFTQDPYILQYCPQSILCMPILHQGHLSGILYLENNLSADVFTSERLEALEILASQAAISIENARLYEQQQNYLEQMKELDRLKDEFLANTSHELRTPITGIIGLSESLLDGIGGPPTPEQAKNLGLIAQSGKRLAHLINDIQDLSRLKNRDLSLTIQPVGLREITALVMTLCRSLVGQKDLRLINDVADDIPAVAADENRLQQILFNLVGNAIKFTQQGTVNITAEIEEKQIWVHVTDTGIGVVPDKLERIFNAFEQADGSISREYGGTGLGLYLTKQLVELHQGTLKVHSIVGQGSKFSFSLPLSTQQSLHSDDRTPQPDIPGGQIPEITPPAPLDVLEIDPTILPVGILEPIDVEIPLSMDVQEGDAQKRILIVDDDPVNLQVLLNILIQKKYSVSAAVNGREALEVLEMEPTIELILLDVMMPEMNGFQVCQEIRHSFDSSDLPVILLTARTQPEDVVQGLEAGANDYLTKPVNKEELIARIQTHLEVKESVKRLKENQKLQEEIGRRQQTELKLEGTQRQLIRILDTTPEALIAFDQDHKITYFNQKAEKLFGYSFQELLGNSVSTIFPDLDQALIEGWQSATRWKLPNSSSSDAYRILVKTEEPSETAYSLTLASLKGESGSVLSIKDPIADSSEITPIEGPLSTLVDLLAKGQPKLLEQVRRLPATFDQVQDLVESLQETDGTTMPEEHALVTAAPPEQEIREVLVKTMNLSLNYWRLTTQKGKGDLAEESTIWYATFDKEGVFRTRTMDRYFNLKTLPKKPNWRDVLQTAYFVLQSCPDTAPELKKDLEQQIQQIDTLLQ